MATIIRPTTTYFGTKAEADYVAKCNNEVEADAEEECSSDDAWLYKVVARGKYWIVEVYDAEGMIGTL